ncbi:hypothetical protein B0H13DRAFT_2672374 [Mycena leptocephala]|nr:hypothetical protein B0H13DRAFT_2672374 [Mycena leptocephala]
MMEIGCPPTVRPHQSPSLGTRSLSLRSLSRVDLQCPTPLPSPAAAVFIPSFAPLDLHVKVFLMRITQLGATFPLTLRRYDRLVLPPSGNAFESHLVDPTGAADLRVAAFACHETGSLVVQHAFENLKKNPKDGIVDELQGQGATVFGEVARSQWGSYCIHHILEHGSEKHCQTALEHLLTGLLEFVTNDHGSKSVVKALKEVRKETLDRVVQRMCEPAKRYIFLSSFLSFSRLTLAVVLVVRSRALAHGEPGDLPTVRLLSLDLHNFHLMIPAHADKDQRAALYDCIRRHIVTLRGCKMVIWLL